MSKGDEHRQARQNARWNLSRTLEMTLQVLPDCWLSIFLAFNAFISLAKNDFFSLLDNTSQSKFYLSMGFSGSNLSWEIIFPGKSSQWGSYLSQKVNFPGKSTFLGGQLSRIVPFPRK